MSKTARFPWLPAIVAGSLLVSPLPSHASEGEGGVSFSSDVTDLHFSQGESCTFFLDAGPENAFRPYIIVGSLTGTSPGIPVESIVVPLVLDRYTAFTVMQPNHPAYTGFLGLLDANGRAEATFTAGPTNEFGGLPVIAHHAFLLFDPQCDFVSNSVEHEWTI